jgi:hypothetical protein
MILSLLAWRKPTTACELRFHANVDVRGDARNTRPQSYCRSALVKSCSAVEQRCQQYSTSLANRWRMVNFGVSRSHKPCPLSCVILMRSQCAGDAMQGNEKFLVSQKANAGSFLGRTNSWRRTSLACLQYHWVGVALADSIRSLSYCRSPQSLPLLRKSRGRNTASHGRRFQYSYAMEYASGSCRYAGIRDAGFCSSVGFPLRRRDVTCWQSVW